MAEERPEQRIQPIALHQEMQRSYLEYAMSVIVGRALPDVRDGLKPVQRRILFATDPVAQRGEALRLAELALNEDPNYVLDSYQAEQLWGTKLRGDTRRLLAQPELKIVVERAMANATAAEDPAAQP